MPANTGYTFNITNSDGTSSSTRVDFGDMFISKDSWYNAGLWGWGATSFGALGNGTTSSYSSPIQVGSLTTWRQVSAGYYHSLLTKVDGTLWGCGYNTQYQLGNGVANTGYSSPIQIGALTNWKQAAAGTYYSMAVKTDGTLWAWGSSGSGSDNSGALGTGTNSAYASPVQVGLLTNWKQVSIPLGISSTLAIKTNGTLWAWGDNSYGQLGYEVGVFGTTSQSSPVQVGSLSTWATTDPDTTILTTSIVHTSAAIKADGSLWIWGRNRYGEIANGLGTVNVYYSSPIQVGALTNWKQISFGEYYWMATKTDGTLWGCGYNRYGKIGTNDTSNRVSPTQIGSLTDWKQVACGLEHTVAVKTDGTLWACGYNVYGRLGNGTTISYSSPVQIGSSTTWKQVACGDFYTAAVKTDGTLWTWGYGAQGQLGNGTTTNYSSPIQIGSLTNWKQVDCGDFYTAAIKTDGTLWTWGINNTGQLGNGTTINYSSPIQVGSLPTWKQVSTGSAHTAAVKTDGTLWTWGHNSDLYGKGNLGNGTIIDYSSPIQIGSLTTWTQVSAGDDITLAYTNSGKIYAFGYNGYGQLGYQTSALGKKSSPVQVGALTNWKQISGSAAVKTDGTLWTWGSNVNGQLGNGTTIDYSSPIQIGSLTGWKQVSSGDQFKFAIKTDGTLWSWGQNHQGQLGNGTTIDYSSPIQIGLLTSWKQVSTGVRQAAAIKTDGTLWACGYNATGVLGNGTRVYYSSPIQIGSLTIWKQVSSSYNFNLAIQAPDLELAKYVPGPPTGLSI